jgi:hypothetical protein
MCGLDSTAICLNDIGLQGLSKRFNFAREYVT